MSPFVKPPTGKSFRFVRACERARRGEAVWASERRFDGVARAGGRRNYLLLLLLLLLLRPPKHVKKMSRKKLVFTQGFSRFSRTTLVKPM